MTTTENTTQTTETMLEVATRRALAQIAKTPSDRQGAKLAAIELLSTTVQPIVGGPSAFVQLLDAVETVQKSDIAAQEYAGSLVTEAADLVFAEGFENENLDRLAACCTTISMGEGELVRLANRLAWSTRGRSAEETDLSGTGIELKLKTYLLLERARMLFKHDEVRKILTWIEKEPSARLDVKNSLYLRAVGVYADLLERNERDHEVDIRLSTLTAEACRDATEAKLAERVLDVITQAWWLAHWHPNQAERLKESCDAALEKLPGGKGVIHYRRASALRVQKEYKDALLSIRKAIDSIETSGEFARTFSEQCLVERRAVLMAQELDALAGDLRETIDSKIERATTEATEQVSSLESRMTGRILELVSLFIAAVTFALLSFTSANSGDLTIGERISLAALSGAGLAGFASLTVVLVGYLKAGSLSVSRWIGSILTITIVVALFVAMGVFLPDMLLEPTKSNLRFVRP